MTEAAAGAGSGGGLDGWFVLLGATALLWTVMAVLQGRFWRSVARLEDVDPSGVDAAGLPTVAVIVPSRDEGPHVEAATRSLLAQDHPGLCVVAVDDRSTDQTGAVLDRIAAEDTRLRVVHVDTLPEGWLGKNHANHVGAATADTAWLLFTDGDVVMAPDAVRRALVYALRERRDHVAIMPRLECDGLWGRAVQTATFGLLSVRYRMWELRTPRTRGFCGMGAFNLVRRSAYLAAGGHERLRMEVADDLKLGMVVRRAGGAQAVLSTEALVRVRWHAGFLATLRGLVKNAFAGTNWTWRWMVPALAVALLPIWLPVVGVVVSPRPEQRALALWSVVLMVVLHARSARRLSGGCGVEGLAYPVVGTALAGLMFYAAALATWRGGMTWRDTFYRLDALRDGCVDEGAIPVDRVVG